jgi:putative ABC transport system permease protein
LSAINFINLKTAQASQRAKEIGVRKAIGSTKSNLVLQFLLETFVICFASYVLALALTELLLPSFNKFYDKEIVMNDWHIYYYSFAMVLAVTLISGLIPATYLANFWWTLWIKFSQKKLILSTTWTRLKASFSALVLNL